MEHIQYIKHTHIHKGENSHRSFNLKIRCQKLKHVKAAKETSQIYA